MVANPNRRELIADTAIDVLADGGLTHRAVDHAANLPPGTTKNYYPTREALLMAAADRVYQRYLDDQAELEALGGPADREQLIALVAELFRRVTTVDRPRLLALLALHGEAPRNTALQELLAAQTTVDLDMYYRLQQSAGLPVTPERSHVVGRSMQSALISLASHSKDGLVAQGLDDLDGFVRGVIDAVYPRGERR